MLSNTLRPFIKHSSLNQISVFNFGSIKKDYYEILNISKNATQQEIKDAYKEMAKKYHPDVRTNMKSLEGNSEMFKAVAEAYAVLSVPESKLSYDLLNQQAPEHIFRSNRMEYMKRQKDIGNDGQIKKEQYKKGSYADEKQQILAEERKKFNVNAFGRYQGGLPQQGKGYVRGSAMGSPGSYHESIYHNAKINPNPDSQFVTTEDALAFKHYMNEDKFSLSKRKIWFPVELNKQFFEFKHHQNAWRWLRNFLVFVVGFQLCWEIHQGSANRRARQTFEQLKQAHPDATQFEINGRKVVIGKTGMVLYAE